jgi:hypothetical protein
MMGKNLVEPVTVGRRLASRLTGAGAVFVAFRRGHRRNDPVKN